MLLEEVIACGVLAKKLVAKHLVVVSAALRDDGAFCHYLPRGVRWRPIPGCEVFGRFTDLLVERGVPYLLGKAWTTAGP